MICIYGTVRSCPRGLAPKGKGYWDFAYLRALRDVVLPSSVGRTPTGQPGSKYYGVTKWWHLAFVTTCLTCIFLLLTMASNNGRYPWELTSLQRGLVDNCFEEGQYETAIATLDQLRSPDFNPHPWVRLVSFYSSTQFFQPSSTTIDIYFPSIYARADSWIRYWHLCSNVSV